MFTLALYRKSFLILFNSHKIENTEVFIQHQEYVKYLGINMLKLTLVKWQYIILSKLMIGLMKFDIRLQRDF